MIQRRKFITLLGGTALTWSPAARAQQPTMPVIGFLDFTSLDRSADRMRAFRQGLGEVGFVEGRSVTVEYRWADYHYDRLSALAADLVQSRVDVIVATTNAAAGAAKAATTRIPIVFYIGSDPVERGFVTSLNRPGGNLTGFSNVNGGLVQKRLELLHEAVPMIGIVVLLANPTNPAAANQSRDIQVAAQTLGLQAHVLYASSDRDFDTVFPKVKALQAGAMVIGPDLFFFSRSEELAALSVHHAIPAIHQFREFAAAGGLMSYGGSYTDSYRQVGVYTGRILKGEKPADLPVQQTAKVNLVLNLNAAKTLGLTFPLTLLGRADEVIE